MISNNTIIPSIRKYKYFEKALSCQSEYVLLSEANIGNLQSLIGKCHQSGKKVLVHLELLGGFKPDQAGINLLKNYYKVDGVISSNLSALRYAKKEGLLTVYRVLLIDSRSLDQSLDIVKEGANKQVISSQADSLIKISRIWADFFPANTSNQPI